MSKQDYSSPPPWIAIEDEVPQEWRNNVLSKLPREKGWGEPYLYQYQGFWYQAFLFHNVLRCQKHFQAQNTDLIVASTPKSGTTWLKSLAFALLYRKSYHPNDNQHPLLRKNSHDLVPFLELDIDFENPRPDHLSFYSSPRLFSSHLPYQSMPKSVKESSCKLIYICRNPKDAFISLWHYTNKLRAPEMGTLPIEEAFDKFCRGVSLIGPFWDHVLGYWQESLKMPDKILFLKYEEIKERSNTRVKRIAEFYGNPFSDEEEASGVVDEIVKLCSFNNLSNLEVNKSGKDWSGMAFNVLFRRGETQDWKRYLTPDMVDKLDRITEEKFHGSGLML
ncbi:hypothetical protein ACH5RR_030403 [Cinchona calisaya]|uniref:Sulfotransferase n=1 Tax=Cinchona calisaya TaxID=153742 RepID=A0ABD2YUH5_9GENT